MSIDDVGPLSGVRVLDLSSVVVGPVATLRLSEFGAEVLKVESPEGDLLRTLGGVSPSGMTSGKFLNFNRGKKLLALDLKHPHSRPLIEKLLDGVDVVISNMRPSALTRLGLDAETCRRGRPRLIHCVITGFGSDGPYHGRAAYDSVLQGATGIVGAGVKRDGAANFAPFVMVDHVVGEITAAAVTAALFKMARTGVGGAIEIPMMETMAAFVLKEHMCAATFEPPLGPYGDMRILNENNRPIATSDGWIAVSANTDAQAWGFLRAVGREDLADDERFSSVSARVANSGEWFRLRAEALRSNTTSHWLERLHREDIPAMRCNMLEDIEHDPHLVAVGLLQREDHPTDGPIRAIRPTVLFDATVPRAGRAAGAPGVDTLSVLSSVGVSEEEIDFALRMGAIVTPPIRSPAGNSAGVDG